MCVNTVASLVADFAALVEVIAKSEVDAITKDLINRLLYRAKDLLHKDSLQQFYNSKIDILNKELAIKKGQVQSLSTENERLRHSLGTSRTDLEVSRLLDVSAAKRKTHKSRSAFRMFNPNKTALQDEFTQRIAALFQGFEVFGESDDFKPTLAAIEASFKRSVNCDVMMVLKRNSNHKYEGTALDNLFVLTGLETFEKANAPIINNAVTFKDVFFNCFYSSIYYTIENYMLVPYRPERSRPVVALLLFANKRSIRGTRDHFNRTDEVFGLLACHVYSILKKYHDFLGRHRKLKETLSSVCQGIEELLRLVRLGIRIEPPE